MCQLCVCAKRAAELAAATILGMATASGAISPGAYRVLGQPDLRQNGTNAPQGRELNGPSGVALDNRDGALYLYVADSGNNRILAWEDARAAQAGEPATLVLGQPGPRQTRPVGIGAKGLYLPMGLAVDPLTGNLYVADYGNNRVLRFAAPFSNRSKVEPDAVFGQPNFNSRTGNPAGVRDDSLRAPRAVAFDSAGNLWIADGGNHRVVRYPADALSAPFPQADMVLGQADFNHGAANRGDKVGASGFDMPSGLAFDARDNLYVSDFNNTRVLKFPAPLSFDAKAIGVYGEPNLTTRGAPPQSSASTLAGPAGISVDRLGNLYVAVIAENRVVVFGSDSTTNAKDVLGQVNFTVTLANARSFPRASASDLASAMDVKVDADGNVFVADTGNHRVLAFRRNAKSADRVWGQADFTANGANQIKPGSINAPYKIAIDYSRSPFALYVSDTNNHRVLGWKDAVRFRDGDPADLVIGQPDFSTAIANIDTRGARKPSATSLASPKGIVVDAGGNLYVADSDNHRVLRFLRPVDQSGRITPDIVVGQRDFTSADSAAVSAASLKSPAGVAIGPEGSLFVADSGNNRVLEFPAGAATFANAVRVYGQPDFNSSTATTISAQSLTGPQGIAVDGSSNLYVADYGNNRVLVFASTRFAPATGGTASAVIGQAKFDAVEAGAGSARFRGPVDVAVDSAGAIYVSDTGNSRVLTFPMLLFLPIADAAAAGVVGQRNTDGAGPNWNSPDGLATAESLYSPLGILLDRRDTLYVGDAGNNRVVHFLAKAAITHAATPKASIPVARGGLAVLYGSGLAAQEEKAPEEAWPVSLQDREVVFDGEIKAPLSFVSGEQINFQVPSNAPTGTPRIAVRVAGTAELLAGTAYPVADVSPGLFTASTETAQGRIENENGTANNASAPAARGAIVRLFGSGQGPVTPPVPDGVPVPADGEVHTVATPTSDGVTCLNRQPAACVAVGSSMAEVVFSGMAPGAVGLWRLDVRIPENAITGAAVPVRAVINGIPTNIVSIAIR